MHLCLLIDNTQMHTPRKIFKSLDLNARKKPYFLCSNWFKFIKKSFKIRALKKTSSLISCIWSEWLFGEKVVFYQESLIQRIGNLSDIQIFNLLIHFWAIYMIILIFFIVLGSKLLIFVKNLSMCNTSKVFNKVCLIVIKESFWVV